MSNMVRTGEMDVNIDLLPEPGKQIDTLNIQMFQWGWPGVTLNRDVLLTYKHNIEELLSFIFHNSNGVFFLLIKDTLRDRWIYFSDLYSCKKIFYMQKGQTLYFTDFMYKFKPLLNPGQEMDKASIGLFLMYGYIPGNETLYRSVKSLKPFTYYEYRNVRVKEYTYYHVEFEPINMSYQQAVVGTKKILEDRLISLSRGFKKFLVPLSGGRDSRFLLALALKHFPHHQVTTFTFGQKGTMDFEIGKRFARRFGLNFVLLPFQVDNYFEEQVKPATLHKNGAVNHACNAPATFYEKVLNDQDEHLIVSGFIGDAVLAWSHQKRLVTAEEGFRYPETGLFSLPEIIGGCFPFLKDEFYTRLRRLVQILYDRKGNLETERWLYYIHVPYFTNPCMFAEEKFYPFVLPFVDVPFFEFMKTVPAAHKIKTSYYEDILREDEFVYPFFQYPLKTLGGAGYGNGKTRNILWKGWLNFLALSHGSGRMKNYIRFESAYSDDFLRGQCTYLEKFKMLNPLIQNFDRYSFKKKCVLLSLKLNLETFF